MASARDPDQIRLQGFKSGVNNVAPPTRPPRDEFGAVLSVAEAVNVDFDAGGRPRRRRGQIVEDPRPSKSGTEFGGYLVVHVENDIRMFLDTGVGLNDEGALVEGVGAAPATFAHDDFDLYWSTASRNGRIDAAMETHPLWIDTPDPALAAASAAGGLGAGQYEVSVSAVDGEGRESGGSLPAVVQVAAGGGIDVTLPAPPEGAELWRVYVSGADGDVLYFARELPAEQSSVTIGAGARGEQQPTAWLFPFPACHTLRYAHGRMYGLAGNVLWWSEPYRIGLVHADNHLVLGAEATLLEPMETGLYVADHKRTYWMDGTDPDQWRQRVVHPHPAAPGGSVKADASWFGGESAAPVAVWASANGVFCMGSEGGSVRVLRDNAFVFNQHAERAALGVFEFDGIRQIAMSAMGGTPHIRATAGDSVDVQIRRNGVVLS